MRERARRFVAASIFVALVDGKVVLLMAWVCLCYYLVQFLDSLKWSLYGDAEGTEGFFKRGPGDDLF